MKEEVICYIAMDFFAASNSYDFLNQYCSNLLKNPTVRGLRAVDIFLIDLKKNMNKNQA